VEFVGVGLFIWKQTNVIVRNIISQNVLAANGDGIGVQASTNVWIDHWFVTLKTNEVNS
jgi:pectate lyase